MAYGDVAAPPVLGAIQQQSTRDQKIVEDCLRDFREMQLWRNTSAGQWEEISEILDPNSRNTFFYGNSNPPGVKKTQRQIDSNGMLALEKFKAICDSLLTPRNMFWHALGAEEHRAYLMKDRGVRLWYEQATKALFSYRYAETANFSSQNQMVFHSLGAYGTGGIFVDALDPRLNAGRRGLRYKGIPLGEIFIKENHQGQINSYVRWFKLTAEQAKGQFPDINIAQLNTALQAKSQLKFDFIQWVGPNPEYDPTRRDDRGKQFASYYIFPAGQILCEEGGYHTFPMPVSRYIQAPGEVYGRGPAGQVLPSLKTLNAEKATFLKQGHRASDPVLLTADDGLNSFDLTPGATNPGYMTEQGKRLVDILPTGQIQINEKMMEMERQIIMDAFLVNLFQIMTETPQMTATEVIERTNEKGILLAPTIGRQQSEYLGPLIARELDLLQQLKLLPPMPKLLIEAKGSYTAVYTSPISRAMKAQEAAGFIRTVETVKELVNITGDASLLDPFDFDKAIPAIAQIQAVPESWMSDDASIAKKRKNRAKAQQEQQAVQALPAQAAMMKAQATVAKNQPGAGPGGGGPYPGGLGGPQPQGRPMRGAGPGQMGNG